MACKSVEAIQSSGTSPRTRRRGTSSRNAAINAKKAGSAVRFRRRTGWRSCSSQRREFARPAIGIELSDAAVNDEAVQLAQPGTVVHAQYLAQQPEPCLFKWQERPSVTGSSVCPFREAVMRIAGAAIVARSNRSLVRRGNARVAMTLDVCLLQISRPGRPAAIFGDLCRPQEHDCADQDEKVSPSHEATRPL